MSATLTLFGCVGYVLTVAWLVYLLLDLADAVLVRLWRANR